MPRSASGVYTLAKPAFIAGTTIKSADVNADFSDIATALTQSVASTGVTSMTGPLKLAAGSLGAPSMTFVSALHTGFYLFGPDQIGWSSNSILGATFNSDLSVTWLGEATWVGNIGTSANLAVGLDLNVGGSIVASNADITNYVDLTKQAGDPISPAANKLRFYVKLDGFAAGERPYAEDESGRIFPLMFTGGQCQLTKSGVTLLLSPYQGNRLTINGVPQIVPDVGISLAASNTAATFVYIYAFMNAGVMTLEMSTTSPTLQAGTGVKQKTGDATRTLVGAAYTDAAGAWADTDGKLWVLSYYNRRRKNSKTLLVTSLSVNSTAYLELDASMRNQFINWADETVAINSKTQANTPTLQQEIFVQNNLDSASGDSGATAMSLFTSLNTQIPNYSTAAGMTENAVHYLTLFVRGISNSTVTFTKGASAGENTSIYIQVNG